MTIPYDRVVIINLKRRADRRKEMRRELKKIGLAEDPRVSFLSAVEPPDPGPWKSIGEHGCFMSHVAAIEDAAREGQSVLILEDDCDFTDAAKDSDWGAGADIFYGGYWVPDFADPHAGVVQGSHCMGLSGPAVQAIAPFFESLRHQSSPPPTDGAYVEFRRRHTELKASFASPQVAVQRQSMSDINPGRFDRSPWLAPLVRLGRALNRRRYLKAKMIEGSAQD